MSTGRSGLTFKMNPVFCSPETPKHLRGVSKMLAAKAIECKRKTSMDYVTKHTALWNIVGNFLDSELLTAMFVIAASSYMTRRADRKSQFESVIIKWRDSIHEERELR